MQQLPLLFSTRRLAMGFGNSRRFSDEFFTRTLSRAFDDHTAVFTPVGNGAITLQVELFKVEVALA
jgi:hypothetical protein